MSPAALSALRAVAPSAFEAAGDCLPRPHGNCYWLIPGLLLAGEHPGSIGADALPARLQALCASGVSVSIDLTTPADPMPSYVLLPCQGIDSMRLSHPISDFGVPDLHTMQAISTDVDRALSQGRIVYLHCRAGIGRTGTVAACLMVCTGLDAQRALTLLAGKWQAMDKRQAEPHTPETQAQRHFVAEWQRALPDVTAAMSGR